MAFYMVFVSVLRFDDSFFPGPNGPHPLCFIVLIEKQVVKVGYLPGVEVLKSLLFVLHNLEDDHLVVRGELMPLEIPFCPEEQIADVTLFLP